MTLDGMVKMAKADQYTDEGKQTIEDARRTYKTGDISPATGLQKQPDGSWAPPKGAKNTAKTAGSSAGKPETSSGPAKEKTFTFTKAGHVYNVPASSPAEAVQKLKARGVKGFKESDAFDDSTPRSRTGFSEAKPAENKMGVGSTVKVKVNGNREGKIVETRGDVVTVEMPAQGDKPARREQYYKSDLETAEKPAKKDVAAEQTARNEAMKAAENESQNAAVFNDLNEKAATEGIEYKIRKTKAGEYYWDKYRDGKHVGGGSARDKTDAINRANKNFEEYIKENKTAASRESKPAESDDERDRREASEATVTNTMNDLKRKGKIEDYWSLGYANEDAAKNKLRSIYNINNDDDVEKIWTSIKEDYLIKNATSYSGEDLINVMENAGYRNPGFDAAPGGRSFGVFKNGNSKLRVGVGAQGKVESIAKVKTSKNDTAKDSAPLTGDTKIRVRK